MSYSYFSKIIYLYLTCSQGYKKSTVRKVKGIYTMLLCHLQ